MTEKTKMSEGKAISFSVDGKEVPAREGQTIAEALLSSGVQIMRRTRNGQERCAFCGMGICFECRMVVNGIPNVRACVTLVTAGCKVERQNDAELEKLEVRL